MKKSIFKLHEQINRIHELSGNNIVSGKHLVVVDIQPEYQEWINFLPEFIDFLNENYENLSRLTFLYNGVELGVISEIDYKNWWNDNGLNDEIIESANFYDKGYAFFRYCIDEGVDEDIIVNLVKYIISNKVFDTRELDKEFWDEYVETYGDKNIREMLEFTRHSINIPELMDELQDYYNIILCGGGVTECLKEVEIALKALDKTYTLLTKYTY
jgi:hypothetical protein